MRKSSAIYVFLLAGFLAGGNLIAQDDHFVTLGMSRARAIALGGAFVSVVDDAAAIPYNPGAFSMFRSRRGLKASFTVNPGLTAVRYRYPEQFGKQKEEGFSKFSSALSYLVKFAGFSYRMLDFGVILFEEMVLPGTNERFFDANRISENYFHSAAASLKLSSQVSIGISGSYIHTDDEEYEEEGFGFSYGLFIQPNEFYQVGITYIDYQDRIKSFRKKFERFADESLNVGISIMPVGKTVLLVDVRNITEGDKPDNFGLQEFHFGLEVNDIPHLSLRSGYYREKEEGKYNHVYSAGIGLLDLNRFRSVETRFSHAAPLLSYTIVFEDTPGGIHRWHMLSAGFQFTIR